MTTNMTARELAEYAKKSRPNVRYAYNQKNNGVAAWFENRWVTVAMRTILGHWAEVKGELFINGKPASDGYIWTEV